MDKPTEQTTIEVSNAAERNFSLDSFSRAREKMIATNDNSYHGVWRGRLSQRYDRLKEYTFDEIQDIINNGTISEQQKLSRNYFYKDGYYKQIIIYYATLLTYVGLLIPNPAFGKSLSTPHISKRYHSAQEFVENMQLPIVLTNCAQRALVDGAYYGVRAEASKKSFALIDLPCGYARSRFKDLDGNDVVEFDLSYFASIVDAEARNAALSAYPKIVSKAYKLWEKGKRADSWLVLPSDLGVCFPFFDGRPLFLSVIPATITYDEAVQTERERDAEEIHKILVQKIPHLSDGRLLFEPDEAAEIHDAAVGMMKGNHNVSVLTTYADVDAIGSKTSSDNTDDVLRKIEQNIYAQAGVSSQIFTAEGSAALKTSLTNDLALMMYLANKFSNFITNTLNASFGNGNITFKYVIQPITWYNQKDYVDSAFKLGGAGYSFLMPALGMGLSQRDLVSIKELENDVLKLGESLRPLASSYTQSASESGSEEKQDESLAPSDEKQTAPPQTDEGGRPSLQEEDKSDKTIQNETSKDRTGGGS